MQLKISYKLGMYKNTSTQTLNSNAIKEGSRIVLARCRSTSFLPHPYQLKSRVPYRHCASTSTWYVRRGTEQKENWARLPNTVLLRYMRCSSLCFSLSLPLFRCENEAANIAKVSVASQFPMRLGERRKKITRKREQKKAPWTKNRTVRERERDKEEQEN